MLLSDLLILEFMFFIIWAKPKIIDPTRIENFSGVASKKTAAAQLWNFS